jgi:D-glycero-D-manno-heptose 1,7-bisphosphate phosphatase
MHRAVFIDRDGVINQKVPEPAYVTRWEEFCILPYTSRAISLFNKADFRVIVVTNQRCIAKGLISIAELESIHGEMRKKLAGAGAHIDAIYYCPHEKECCDCRKPAPGMLLEAARIHHIDLSASWMIGDSDSDVEAGRKAGCRTARVVRGHEAPAVAGDVSGPSLLSIARKITRAQFRPINSGDSR